MRAKARAYSWFPALRVWPNAFPTTSLQKCLLNEWKERRGVTVVLADRGIFVGKLSAWDGVLYGKIKWL